MSTKVLTRREFLRIATLAGTGLVAAACAPVVVPTTSPSTGANVASPVAPTALATSEVTPAAGQPKYGGYLTRGSVGDPANFDMFSNSSSLTLVAIAPCYNSLLMFDPLIPGKIIGDLAESWEVSPDGKVYTFKIIKGAKFHDGKPLTSADVKYTFDTLRNPPQGVTSIRKGVLAAVDGIEAPDDYTVRFVLKRKNPSLLTNLATAWFLVAPKHILQEKGDMKKDLIGTGPYKLKEYVRGVSIELVRNPDYHIKGRPYLDGIKIFIVPDAATHFANVRTGQIQFHDSPTGDEARQAEKELGDKIQVQSVSSFIGDPFTMNSQRKPFDDIRVRQALSYAVDRNEAVKVLMGGDAVVSGLLPTSGRWGLSAGELEKIPGFSKDNEANRAAAKKLLQEAGYPNGFSVTIVARKAAGTHEARAILLKEQFSRIGIDAKVDIQETARYLETIEKRNFDIATTVISGNADDPDFLIGDYHTCKGGQNYSGVCNAKADELFDQQSQTVDDVERKKLVNQMEREYLNGFGTVNLYFKNKLMISWRRVHNLVLHSEPDNNRRYQETWLSD